ncbi:SDR family NAD(P)-dependent oxidoreductase [Nonomuraea sp. KC401]|uniref:SDR family NAD(P)-dependent oxidoreductase n=1 Tax=Nonomuraea longispora TaxID=1848320 RepID=A0A4R4NDV7_9ACTN|nr:MULTISPECIES: SDR family NAD(P)-dependent oxidoreductase [Nonomuraea]NBF00192.1 SDR family NAD(P)-dependent oxidoreductase [Nonomuraea sp. K271]TDC07129.1 SDR family NAD(P)-dependent oxidoreductase [Nonomuraea longispora]TLF52937.1 SDR family NAD(P)-dependent oxidoreductase [Nonomuraea sp. KC401]
MSEHVRKAVVTAGTGGIGMETAAGLAAQGWDVTVVGRDPDRGAAATARLEEAAGRATGRFLRADLSSLSGTRALADRLAAEGPLHLLVNNVGGMWTRRWEGAGGIEASLVLNHLSPYVLTEALLDALNAGAPSRIVNVTSSAIMAAEPVFEEAEPPGPYYGMAATGRAKLAHLVHTMDLAGRLGGQGIQVVAVDPGPAATPNAAQMTIDILPPQMRPLWDQVQEWVTRPVTEAGAAVLAACTGPSHGAGVVIGPSGAPDDSLLQYLTEDVTQAVRAWTPRLLGD